MRAYVLAGGASTRMGADKARLPLDGWPAAAVLAGRLEAAGFRAAIVRRERDGLPWLYPDGRPVPVVEELPGLPRHPLAGVLTAVADAGSAAMVVPCDMVRLRASTLARFLEQSGVVADGHPLVGVYLPEPERLREHVLAGGSVRAFVAAWPTLALPPEERIDRNRADLTWPLEQLAAGAPVASAAALRRLLRGERARQRARGVVDPSASRYALDRTPDDGSLTG